MMRLVAVHDHGKGAGLRRYVVVMRDGDNQVRAFSAARRPKTTEEAVVLLRGARE